MSTPVQSAAQEFTDALARYQLFTGKEQGPLIDDRARKANFSLYRHFKALAQTKASLQSELDALRGRVKRRIGKSGKPVSLKTELKLRAKSLNWLSVGFLVSAWRAQKDGQTANFAGKSRSGAQISLIRNRTAKGITDPNVLIASFLDGVQIQNQRRNIADIALREQARDMDVYLKRKHEEKLAQLFGKLADKTVALVA
jgi:hypothetical protein